MRTNPFLFATAPVLAIFVLLGGCGDDSTAESAASAEGFDRCRLLTDAEVEQVIGPHDGGKRDLGNMWGTGSCRWKASAVKDGITEAIEVALFDTDLVENWARGEAEGVPVAGFGDGALYDSTWGQLWFDCARDRFCVVYVSTASSEARPETAKRFAGLVESRLR